jgi:predicted N-acetyltransferase YhbS
MTDIRTEILSDVPSRERLLDACFGLARFRKTCQRLRSGRLPAEGLSLVAIREGQLVGTVRLWHVAAGDWPALMLGPIAVDPALQGEGLGSRLMETALSRAGDLGHGAVILVGDPAYYARFGFSGDGMEQVWLPGPHERHRFLGRELAPGFLTGATGLVRPTGARVPADVAVAQRLAA